MIDKLTDRYGVKVGISIIILLVITVITLSTFILFPKYYIINNFVGFPKSDLIIFSLLFFVLAVYSFLGKVEKSFKHPVNTPINPELENVKPDNFKAGLERHRIVKNTKAMKRLKKLYSINNMVLIFVLFLLPFQYFLNNYTKKKILKATVLDKSSINMMISRIYYINIFLDNIKQSIRLPQDEWSRIVEKKKITLVISNGLFTKSVNKIEIPDYSEENEPKYNPEYNVDRKETFDYFMEVAFGNNPINKIKKWTKDIKIFIPVENDILDKEIDKIILELSEMSLDIDIYRVKKKEDSNYIIFFGNKDDYIETIEPKADKDMGESDHFYFVDWNNINHASIFMDLKSFKNVDQQKNYLRKAFTNSLGLENNNERYPKSIFYNQITKNNYYQDIDKKLIKLLYNPKIQFGMTKQEVMNVIQTFD